MKALSNTLRQMFTPEALLWVYPALLVIPNIVLGITEHTPAIVKIVNILLPFGAYLLLMSVWKNVGRTALFLFPILIYAAFQIVLSYLYGESIIAVDMFINVMTTNVGEVTELLGNLALAITAVVVLYLPPAVWSIVLVNRRMYASAASIRCAGRTAWRLSSLGVVGLVACLAFVSDFDASRHIFPLNVIYNTATAIQRTVATDNYRDTSAGFSYGAESSRPSGKKEIYVMVVGETSRADNWQLFGYERPTNPRLSKRSGLLAYPKALSESNTTHKSVPLMLSWVTTENFGDSIYTTKSIITAFNESGYNTAFFSNQGRNRSFIDFFADEADSTVFLTDSSRNHRDDDLLPLLRKFIGNSSRCKLFIVLHTYGSHFNYNDRYSADMATFRPDRNAEAKTANRAELINAYDNTIICTDRFLDEVISIIEAENCCAAVLYTSDHGEDIFDDSRSRFLHASPVPTYWQLHVPLLLWMSPALREDYPALYQSAREHTCMNVSSSRIVFDTLLSLAGIDTPYADKSNALTDPCCLPRKRQYLNDYNESVSLDEAGLRPCDFAKFAENGIR